MTRFNINPQNPVIICIEIKLSILGNNNLTQMANIPITDIITGSIITHENTTFVGNR